MTCKLAALFFLAVIAFSAAMWIKPPVCTGKYPPFMIGGTKQAGC